MISSEDNLLYFQKISSHGQAEKRWASLLTDAALSVYGSEAIEGYIVTKIKARKDLPDKFL